MAEARLASARRSCATRAGASCRTCWTRRHAPGRAGPAVGGGRGEPSGAASPTFMPVLDPNESNVRVFYLLDTRRGVPRPDPASGRRWSMVRSLLGETFLISNFTANIARPGSRSMALHSDQSLVMPEPWRASLGDEHHLVPDRRHASRTARRCSCRAATDRQRRRDVPADAVARACARSRPRPARSSRWRGGSGTPRAPTSRRTRIGRCCSATTPRRSCARR